MLEKSSRPERKLSPLGIYLRDIDEVPLLTAEEEKELAGKIKEGNSAAREHMIRANLRLVLGIAKRYQNNGLSLEDLVQEGNLGLIRAVERFDGERGTRFSTYAVRAISNEIKRALHHKSKTIRIPVHMLETLSKWKKTEQKLQVDLERIPSFEEVAEELGIPEKKWPLIQEGLGAYDKQPLSGSAVDDDGLSADAGTLIDEESLEPDHSLIKADTENEVHDILAQMPPRDAAILHTHHVEGQTIVEISKCLKISREAVIKIEKRAREKFRKELNARREAETHTKLYELLAEMPPRDAVIQHMRNVEERPFTEIGPRFDMTREAASKIEKTTLEKFRAELRRRESAL